jgi:hypothetical protein
MKWVAMLCAAVFVLAFLCWFVPPPDDVDPILYVRASVRVTSGEGSYSGTVLKAVKQEPGTYTAFVLSTGHMPVTTLPVVEFFYLDGAKVSPRGFHGRILFLCKNTDYGRDFSLLAVDVNGQPSAVAVASGPLLWSVRKGWPCWSVGCDGSADPCLYECAVWASESTSIRTVREQAKPGRSGGGLFRDGRLIGVMYGGSALNMSGCPNCPSGHFVPYSAIREGLEAAGFGHVLGR